MAATATDPRGLKRICMSCGTRFYDLNKRPPVCPNCSAEFSGEIKVKTRRGRIAANDTETEGQVTKATEAETQTAASEEDDEATASGDDHLVSLEDVDEGDDDLDDSEDLELGGDIEDLEDLEDMDEEAEDKEEKSGGKE